MGLCAVAVWAPAANAGAAASAPRVSPSANIEVRIRMIFLLVVPAHSPARRSINPPNVRNLTAWQQKRSEDGCCRGGSGQGWPFWYPCPTRRAFTGTFVTQRSGMIARSCRSAIGFHLLARAVLQGFADVRDQQVHLGLGHREVRRETQ